MKKFYLLMMAGAVLFWGLGTASAKDDNKDAIIKEVTRDGSIQRAVFKVENMTCGACFSNMNVGLSPLEGFSGMGVNLLRNLVAVDFVGPLSADDIGAVITRKGYPATLESVDPIKEKESFAYLNTRRKGRGFVGGCCTLPNDSKLPPVTIN